MAIYNDSFICSKKAIEYFWPKDNCSDLDGEFNFIMTSILNEENWACSNMNKLGDEVKASVLVDLIQAEGYKRYNTTPKNLVWVKATHELMSKAVKFRFAQIHIEYDYVIRAKKQTDVYFLDGEECGTLHIDYIECLIEHEVEACYTAIISKPDNSGKIFSFMISKNDIEKFKNGKCVLLIQKHTYDGVKLVTETIFQR